MNRPGDRALAPALFIGSGITQYTGAALAVILFSVMAPTTVAWWRISISALILLAWRRPWRQKLTWKEVATSALFGVVMAGMNLAFYMAIARLQMGVAVSLEFLGPVMVAVVMTRGLRARLAALIALTGVVLISGFGVDIRQTEIGWGVFWAILAGMLWAGYIVLGQKIATKRSGLTSLAIGSAAGSVVYFPVAAHDFHLAWQSWGMLATVIGVAVLSSVIPYSLDQVVMKRIDAPTFALLTALLPATSALVGAIGLRQFPAAASLVGLACVSVAVWLASMPEKPRPVSRR